MHILSKVCSKDDFWLSSKWFEMLAIVQDDEGVEFSKSFMDNLLEFISEETYSEILYCLIKFINSHLYKDQQGGFEILYAYPLINILHRKVHMHEDGSTICELSKKISEPIEILRMRLLSQEEW